MDEVQRLLLRQGAQTVAGFASSRIRNRKTVLEERRPEPDRPALKAAEELIGRRAQLEGAEMVTTVTTEQESLGGAVMIPDDLFGSVEDRIEVKRVLSAALASPEPVHILLDGEPGSGKSQLLQCIATLPQSRYAVGGATTSSGLTGYLLERPETRYLVIDELDKADQADLYQLYSLMESGVLTRLQHNQTEQTRRKVWVFAAVNSAAKLPDALRSRFVHVAVPSYTPEQIRDITAAVLVKREGMEPARAREIAEAVARRSSDPRDGVQIARLAGATGPIGPIVDQVIPRRQRIGPKIR